MLRVRDEIVTALGDRYVVEEELGQGGAAVVYRARDVKHDRQVAVKLLRSDRTSSVSLERFQREIGIAAHLTHPNILALYDSGVVDGALYYVAPYIAGGTLRQRLDRERQLPIDEAIGIARQIAAALDYAHAHGVVHRDIKPENILLVGDQVLVADFGIARAVQSVSSPRLTDSGVAIGTPLYMSPEQAAGDDDVDGRADVYALACVFFEMIAGTPPFRARSASAVAAQHISSAVPSLRADRPSCPAHIDRAVARALAKAPADRYRTAGEFIRAVSRPMGVAEVLSRMTRPIAAAVGVALVVVFAMAGMWSVRQRAASDASSAPMFAVFPFVHRADVLPPWLDGDACARFLYDAMARWQGVRLVSDLRVRDAWLRHHPSTVDDVIASARLLRARYATWGEVVAIPDSIEIRATTYDVDRGPEAARQVVVRIARDDPRLEQAFAVVAESLVVGGHPGVAIPPGGTRNLDALHEFIAGRTAMEQFDLRTAESHFRRAIAADDSYAQANLWLARTMSWEGADEPSAWGPFAAAAVRAGTSLSPVERMHAEALLALADGRMVESCRRYRDLIARDSLDFAAWFGLGECNSRDRLVVRDARSPTGWSFRGSYHTAIAAYRRALAIVPSFHLAERGAAFTRLSRRVLLTDGTATRLGFALAPDTARFAAFPSFIHDTIAFAPRPMTEIRQARLEAMRSGQARANAWSAGVLAEITEEWVTAFPNSADAAEGYASALEGLVQVSAARASLSAPLSWARRARVLATTDVQRLRLTTAVARLLIKTDSEATARGVADSALRANSSPTASAAAYLSTLAAVAGHIRRAAALARLATSDSMGYAPFRRPNSSAIPLPRRVISDAVALIVFASAGGPRDSIRALFSRVDHDISIFARGSEVAELRETLLHIPLGLAFNDADAVLQRTMHSSRDPKLQLQQAAAQGHTSDVRRLRTLIVTDALDPAIAAASGIEESYVDARILLAEGDTTTATRVLDVALSVLPQAPPILIKVLPRATMLARAMALRAELAAAAGDRPTLERWGGAAVALWGDADPEVRGPIDRVRELTTQRR